MTGNPVRNHENSRPSEEPDCLPLASKMIDSGNAIQVVTGFDLAWSLQQEGLCLTREELVFALRRMHIWKNLAAALVVGFGNDQDLWDLSGVH
jgi:hypothetical protein